MRNFILRLAVTVAALLLPGSAGAIPLGTLTAGGTLASADGAVHFSDFSASHANPYLEQEDPLAGLDLMLIEVDVVTLADLRMLTFTGAIEVAPFALGQLQIRYHAGAGDGFEIVGATLEVDAKTSGAFSSVGVDEDISGDAAASLAVTTRSDRPVSPSAAFAFESSARQLEVTSGIGIDGGTAQGTTFAQLSQGFRVLENASPVPEPSAALVFAAGLVVLGMRVRGQSGLGSVD